MKSYRGPSQRVADPDAPRYPREWQSINNGEDLTLNFNPNIISPSAVGGKIPPEWLHDLTLRIRVKIKVEFE